MISEFKELKYLFEEIDERLKEKVHIYIIGGAVLLYKGLKTATKDVDIVLLEKDEYDNFKKTLLSIRFKKKEPTEEYKNMEINDILVRDDFRIDLFYRTVCKKFIFSNEMKKRAEKIIPISHLNIYISSNEDIFLFKSLTIRKGDLDDCITLAKRDLDWNVIFNEIQNQIKISKQPVWITWIGERLDLLVEKGFKMN